MVFSQQNIKNLYNKIYGIYEDQPALKKTRNSYLQKYNEAKDSDYLIYSKFVELYIYKEDTIGNIRRSYEMIGLSKKNSTLRSEAYFQAAIFLENNSLDLSLKYLKESDKINQENNYEYLSLMTYHILGRNYYKRKDYPKAMYYFNKALMGEQKNKNYLMVSSMYNNIGLTYDKMGKISDAIKNTQKGIFILESAKSAISYEKWFLYLMINNLADYYFKIKDYDKAEMYYQQAFQYFYSHPKFKNKLSRTIPNLYSLYQDNPAKRENLIVQIQHLLDHDKSFSLNTTILEILQDNAIKRGSRNDIEKISLKLNDYMKGYRHFLNKKNAGTMNTINYNLTEEFIKEQKIQQQKALIVYICITAGLLLFMGGVYYLYRIKNLEKKEAIIQKEFLEKENSWIQERLNYIKLNLDLKTKTEKELLKRLKSLRKSQNNEAQEVVKDLYLNISNLLQIDKRQESDLLKDNAADYEFLEKIKRIYPDLTPQELKLCGYLRLPLTSKEVATFIDSTPGAVRVAKTKIKQKMSLPKEQKLDDFLKKL